MGRRARRALGVPPILLALLLVPTAADAASPHLKVRGVFPGSAAAPLAEYVELQAIAPGQTDVTGQAVEFYDGAGALDATFTIPGDVPNGESQRAILLATAEAASLGILAPDFTLPSAGLMSPAGGAACITGAGAGTEDCVSWGSIPLLKAPFPDPQRANSLPLAGGNALSRSIVRGCADFHDPADDTANSGSDFITSAPQPRNNASPVSGTPCVPDTFITVFPGSPSKQTSINFQYTESPQDPVASFDCALDWEDPLDAGDLAPCPAGSLDLTGLSDGLHRLAVRATGQGGTDPSPDLFNWVVDTVPPQTTIVSTPPPLGWGIAVSFAYGSSEPDSGFHCRLDSGAIQVCTEVGKSYFALADGLHVFRVWATDNAGNRDESPAEHAFSVDNRIGDFTPADTRIVAAPPNPSAASTAAFAYASTEAGSAFECRLGPGRFAPCPRDGIGYTGLRNGFYTFEVRSVDPAGNVDSVPASHRWRVAAPTPNTRFRSVPPGQLPAKGRARVPVTFAFASEPGAGFRCRIDLVGGFKPCRSPFRFEAEPGRHVFQVMAVDRLGNLEDVPAFRIFRVRTKQRHAPKFTQSGRFLSSLSAWISPAKLPRDGSRPVHLRFSSAFENLDGTDIPALKTMTMRLARGGTVQREGLPRCAKRRLEHRTARAARAICGDALVGRGTAHTALRFPEGDRIRSKASLLLFNARGGVLMHIFVTEPLGATFIVPIAIHERPGAMGTVLKARFPKIIAGHGHVTSFSMKLGRVYRYGGERRSYLRASCPAPRGVNQLAFELARVEYRFRGGLRLRNSTFNVCKVSG